MVEYYSKVIEERKMNIQFVTFCLIIFQMYMDKLLKRLNYLNRERLSSADRVTYDVIKDTIQTWVDGYKWRL